jgi:hypothetical protein
MKYSISKSFLCQFLFLSNSLFNLFNASIFILPLEIKWHLSGKQSMSFFKTGQYKASVQCQSQNSNFFPVEWNENKDYLAKVISSALKIPKQNTFVKDVLCWIYIFFIHNFLECDVHFYRIICKPIISWKKTFDFICSILYCTISFYRSSMLSRSL